MAPHQASWAERRMAMRVPVHGNAVVRGDASDGDGDADAVYGTVENLSYTGALLRLTTPITSSELDLELHLADGRGCVRARAVRVSPVHPSAGAFHLACEFDGLEPALRDTIVASIAGALRAARERTVLVIDEDAARREQLIDRLVDRGVTPLAPRTPLEVIELLASPTLHVRACLLAPSFGMGHEELAKAFAEHFPWVATAEISDDLAGTADRAVTAMARGALADELESGRIFARELDEL